MKNQLTTSPDEVLEVSHSVHQDAVSACHVRNTILNKDVSGLGDVEPATGDFEAVARYVMLLTNRASRFTLTLGRHRNCNNELTKVRVQVVATLRVFSESPSRQS